MASPYQSSPGHSSESPHRSSPGRSSPDTSFSPFTNHSPFNNSPHDPTYRALYLTPALHTTYASTFHDHDSYRKQHNTRTTRAQPDSSWFSPLNPGLHSPESESESALHTPEAPPGAPAVPAYTPSHRQGQLKATIPAFSLPSSDGDGVSVLDITGDSGRVDETEESDGPEKGPEEKEKSTESNPPKVEPIYVTNRPLHTNFPFRDTQRRKARELMNDTLCADILTHGPRSRFWNTPFILEAALRFTVDVLERTGFPWVDVVANFIMRGWPRIGEGEGDEVKCVKAFEIVYKAPVTVEQLGRLPEWMRGLLREPEETVYSRFGGLMLGEGGGGV
ncbi:hypothetical protein BJ508DRAFT_366514 [Ascobolus immersus RN42]|uniref:Uncharacterized protein n=1 Tax=Ascobolus immersus RN42 TaxID=1160509 RepID=A0A3N4HPE7_ASCIM|nr:hypothetical protein BJ508DRAFT_366514 [Ascobolus immersus RN42]